MKVSVCVPWIDVNCIWRERSRTWTRTWWWNVGVEVVYGVCDARPVNRARARNLAAKVSDADVLFFCDADMWVSAEQFHAAVSQAADTGCMVLAYTDHTRLNKAATTRILDGVAMSYDGQTVRGCSGGAFAVTRELYETVGGHDERYDCWGYEDRSFQFACDTLAGPGQRLKGTSWHLWHPRGIDQARTPPERLAGAELAKRYKKAAGVLARAGIVGATKDAVTDPVAMRAILSEPGGPLSAQAVISVT